jgi:hypothetical protein
MGIYSNGEIHGVRWFDSNIFHSRTYPMKMNLAQCLEIKANYEKLTDAQKSVMDLHFYTPCAYTGRYPVTPFRMWFPGDWATFEVYVSGLDSGN